MGRKFELLTRDGCHLCDDMQEVLDRAWSKLGVEYTLVDVDREPDLRDRFGDVVPVLLRDGQPVAKVRLDSRQAERIARGRR